MTRQRHHESRVSTAKTVRTSTLKLERVHKVKIAVNHMLLHRPEISSPPCPGCLVDGNLSVVDGCQKGPESGTLKD